MVLVPCASHSLTSLSGEAGSWSQVSLMPKSAALCLLQSQECEVIWHEAGTENGWKRLRLLFSRLTLTESYAVKTFRS